MHEYAAKRGRSNSMNRDPRRWSSRSRGGTLPKDGASGTWPSFGRPPQQLWMVWSSGVRGTSYLLAAKPALYAIVDCPTSSRHDGHLQGTLLSGIFPLVVHAISSMPCGDVTKPQSSMQHNCLLAQVRLSLPASCMTKRSLPASWQAMTKQQTLWISGRGLQIVQHMQPCWRLFPSVLLLSPWW